MEIRNTRVFPFLVVIIVSKKKNPNTCFVGDGLIREVDAHCFDHRRSLIDRLIRNDAIISLYFKYMLEIETQKKGICNELIPVKHK